MKRDETDRRALNGFALRERTGKTHSSSSGSLGTARNGRRPNSNRSLNGFILKGTTDFGFSVAPRR